MQHDVQANYNYVGCELIESSIDTSSLLRCSQGIEWSSGVNKNKLCHYSAMLETPLGNRITVDGQFQIIDIVETNQKNPSLVLQDIATNIVAGEDRTIQTSTLLNSKNLVIKKILGLNVPRESHIHCSMPMIHHEQFEYPSLYLIISSKSIYVGITYRLLSYRIYEHCTYKWKDDTVKRGKRTYDMLAYEDADVYCIGRFTDYTIDDIESMSEEERAKFHTKMESVETIFITLASKQFPHLELVNRKQILKDDNELKASVLQLASDNFFEILWGCWDDMPNIQANYNSYSEEIDEAMINCYKLLYDEELTDDRLNLFETVGVELNDFIRLLNEATKPRRGFGRIEIDYNNPTAMPTGRAKDRFDGYLGYKYNPNPKYNKSKPYYKKTIFGYVNKSVAEMESMVKKSIEEHKNKHRKFFASMIDGHIEITDREGNILYSKYIAELDYTEVVYARQVDLSRFIG